MDKLRRAIIAIAAVISKENASIRRQQQRKYLLVQKGVLDKQRGLSMVVAKGAKDLILNDKIKNNLSRLIEGLINEADKLNFSKAELFKLIETHYTERGEKNE